MKKDKKAKIILEYLDTVIQVNWNMEDYYIDAIAEGLEEIEIIEECDDTETF